MPRELAISDGGNLQSNPLVENAQAQPCVIERSNYEPGGREFDNSGTALGRGAATIRSSNQ
jgi:hypothetical protein